jgi:predicted NBD/HSP70 family sugar kinase
MRFYNRQHRHYCGIDLHVKSMYVCILDATGQVLVHRNVPSTPEAFLETLGPVPGRAARAHSEHAGAVQPAGLRTTARLSRESGRRPRALP